MIVRITYEYGSIVAVRTAHAPVLVLLVLLLHVKC